MCAGVGQNFARGLHPVAADVTQDLFRFIEIMDRRPNEIQKLAPLFEEQLRQARLNREAL